MSAKPWSSLAVVLLVAACGNSSPPAAESAKRPADSARPQPERRETVFDPWIGTIDRAKAVQNTVDDQSAEQRRKIEEATR
ncbi:MAG TPA: hypothetical protein VMU03_13755 [Gammaproteobacteria bacterium]|nr:hypothetical protein [Gammaproteobacteria bacterium]